MAQKSFSNIIVKMQKLLESILEGLIGEGNFTLTINDAPDAIRVEIATAESNYPILIGKAGMTIKAITSLARFYFQKNNPESTQKVFIDVR